MICHPIQLHFARKNSDRALDIIHKLYIKSKFLCANFVSICPAHVYWLTSLKFIKLIANRWA